MVHDIDRGDALYAHKDAYLPQPNVIIFNPENGHAHCAYLLKTPVARHSAARPAPLRFFAAVERGAMRRLRADRNYSGLIAKNPLHSDWRAEWRHPQPYTLEELADWLFPWDTEPEASPSVTFGAGRNCTVFEQLRHIAYREVREFKRHGTEEAFRSRLERVALGINLQFPQALALAEIRSIAKSVARWTWRNFSLEDFSRRQSYRGTRGMAKRWAGHVANSTTKPWLAMGISRSSYYRRKKQSSLRSQDNDQANQSKELATHDQR